MAGRGSMNTGPARVLAPGLARRRDGRRGCLQRHLRVAPRSAGLTSLHARSCSSPGCTDAPRRSAPGEEAQSGRSRMGSIAKSSSLPGITNRGAPPSAKPRSVASASHASTRSFISRWQCSNAPGLRIGREPVGLRRLAHRLRVVADVGDVALERWQARRGSPRALRCTRRTARSDARLVGVRTIGHDRLAAKGHRRAARRRPCRCSSHRA